MISFQRTFGENNNDVKEFSEWQISITIFINKIKHLFHEKRVGFQRKSFSEFSSWKFTWEHLLCLSHSLVEILILVFNVKSLERWNIYHL